MKNSKTEESEFNVVAKELGVSFWDVKTVVNSFFDSISNEAKSLPFDNYRKIYTKAAFDKYSFVRSIPFVGRIGPTYSRYLRWRSNESENIETRTRPKTRSKLFPEEIEAIVEILLNGGEYKPEKKRPNYKRIWIVGDGYKKQARQIIVKDKEDNVHNQES